MGDPAMAEYRLLTSLFIPRDQETTFAFFAEASNLQRLTPPWLDFRIVSPMPVEMNVGTIIDYRLKVHGLPIRWRSEISMWNPPRGFVDRQVRGPYRFWEHSHAFTTVPGGTLVEDTVRYRPLGGRLAHKLMVRRDLEKIFLYRQQETLKALDVHTSDPIRVRIERRE